MSLPILKVANAPVLQVQSPGHSEQDAYSLGFANLSDFASPLLSLRAMLYPHQTTRSSPKALDCLLTWVLMPAGLPFTRQLDKQLLIVWRWLEC